MSPRHARLGALLLSVVVLVAACGTGADDGAVGTSTTTTAAPPVVPSTGEDTGAVPPGSTGRSEPPGTVDAPAGAPVGSTTSTSVAPSDAAVAIRTGPVGSLAATYLRPSASAQVLVHVLAQDGAGPRPAVPERIRQVLSAVSGKPVSVATAGLTGGARSWTSADLRALADAESPAQTSERAVLTLLFVHGGFAENDRAVGVAVRGDVAAVFADRVDEAAGVLGSRAAVEDAVAMHEVGHLLGLVDLVVDTGREDPEHPGHSPNRGSVMYYAVESTLLGSILAGGPPRDFDQADLDELARIRNG